MKIYEIKNLNCKEKKNRMLLIDETKKLIKTDRKPSKKKLESICGSLSKKYGLKIGKITFLKDGQMQVAIEGEDGSYSVFVVDYYYEFLCKYILYVKAKKDAKGMKAT